MKALPVFEFARSQWLNAPQEQVFRFFERPENLAQVTPPALDFQLLSPSPVKMREGALIEYTIRQQGLRLRWRTLISDYQAPNMFIDQQLLGPYAFWHHEHRFSRDGERTRMDDRVRYALPNWLPAWFARWLDRTYIRPQLHLIFDYRAKQFPRLISQQQAAKDMRCA